MGRTLIILGLVLVAVGVAASIGSRLPFRFGRLPGDIVWRGRNSAFYFPLMTCLLASALLSLVAWIVSRFK